MVIGLQHLILKENRANQQSLTLSVSTNFISLSLRDYFSNNLLKFDKKVFQIPLSVENINEEIQKLLDSNNYENRKFDKIKLIQENNFFVLVPEELYSLKEKTTYLKFKTEIKDDDFVAVDNLNNFKIKNVYIPYVNVNNYLVDLFNHIDYYHYNTELINKLFEIRTNEQFFVNVNNGKIKIVLFNEDSLAYFNSYDIENSSDIIYYILLTLKEYNLEINKTEIVYIIDHNYDNLFDMSSNFFDNYKILNEDFQGDFLHC